MLWHIVTLELGALSEPIRSDLEAKIDRLREIEDIVWFQSGRDVERPENTAFISVLVDRVALERYRVHPIHVELAQALRDNHVVARRLDLGDLSVPS